MESAKKEKQSFDKLNTSGMLKIDVLRGVYNAILAVAGKAYPNEACGLLLGEGNRISNVVETRNVHPTPRTHFEIDPQALIDAHRTEREGGLQILGYFHSHPAGDPSPSATDRALSAGDGKVWAIVGRVEKGDSEGGADSDILREKGDAPDPQSDACACHGVRFWRDDEAGFVPLSYSLLSG